VWILILSKDLMRLDPRFTHLRQEAPKVNAIAPEKNSQED
jgi:hypothetical protein